MSMIPGVLHVLSDPGKNIPEDKFHDWYNNEHGPERMRLDGINSGIRYRAQDGMLPLWIATYELDDVAFLQHPTYTQLRENRNPRELVVISSLDALECNIYRLVTTRGTYHGELGDVLVTVGLTVSATFSSDLERWYAEEHIDLLSRVPGWFRSRLLVANNTDTSSRVLEYLAIHEYASSNGLGGTEHKAAMSTPWRVRVMSAVESGPRRRVFSLYRVLSKLPNDLEHLPKDAPRIIDSYYQRKDGAKLHYRLEGNPTGSVLAFSNSLLTDLHIWDWIVPHITHK